MSVSLVLGGGGVAGIAWMTGLLTGLADGGLDMSGADVIVGTSAGSAVAAQLGSGLSLEQLYARQVEPALQAAEIMVDVDFEEFGGRLGALLQDTTDAVEARRRLGALALDTKTVPERERRAVIESRLPVHTWPERKLRITAVDVETGELRVFDAASGVPLVDAVTASCAVPGVWPTVGIGGRRYMDGGIRSNDNADLAAGASRVLVLSPMGGRQLLPSEAPLEEAVAGLRAAGTEVAVVEPDEASWAAMGTNPLDPATRRPAAEAGRAQGRQAVVDWS